jgi:hypothetical protein
VQSTRILTAAALTAGGLVLSAGAAGAQTSTPNPDLRSFVTGPSCAERVVTGSVRAVVVASTLPKGARPTMTVQLRWNAGGPAYTDTSVVSSQSFFLTAGNGDYSFSLSAANVPATATNLLAYAITYPDAGSPASETLQSKVLPASSCAAAPSSTTITNVELACSGDVLSGQAVVADPPSSGTVPGSVVAQKRAEGATTWVAVPPAKNYTVGSSTTTMPFEVSLGGLHAAEYRARATVNNGVAVFSPIVSDATCAPAEVVPEAPAAALIPLTLAATAGAVVVVRRRRSASSTSSSSVSTSA